MNSKFPRLTLSILSALILLAVARAFAQPQPDAPLPLLAHWTMEPANGQIADAGPLHLNADAQNVAAIPGMVGQATQFAENSHVRVAKTGLIDRAGAAVSATLWIKFDAYGNGAGLLAKREQNVAAPFDFTLGRNGELGFEGNTGAGWDNVFSGPNAVPVGRWTQVGFSYQAGGELLLFVDGKIVARKKVARALASNDQGLFIGRSPVRGAFVGAIDEVKLYAAALSQVQIEAGKTDALPTRAAIESDFPAPTHLVNAALVRYDRPLGFQEGYGRTRQNAQRVAGPDAIDWPNFTLTGKPLWRDSALQALDVTLRDGVEARPLFQQPYDETVQPGNHWFRALQWMWGQRYVYTTDRTARTWMTDYELWSFPVIIQGAGENDVRDVVLKADNQTIYENKGPLHSLTLLLPQNESGKSYQLSVSGRGPLSFQAGLQPIKIGDPEEKLLPIDLVLPGAGPKITVRNLARPREFPNAQQWQDDVQKMAALPMRASDGAKGKPQVLAGNFPATEVADHAQVLAALSDNRMTAKLGVEVPRSPLTINAVALPHGMSGGAFFSGSDHMKPFAGNFDEFARYAKTTGYDRIFERSSDPVLIAALNRYGVGYGLVPDTEWGRPFLTHSNVAFFSANLPDWHAPLYRDLQLQAQALKKHPNFQGFSIGADNGGYVSFWDWAPPIPNRPWGEAFMQFAGGKTAWPMPKHLGGQSTVSEFLDYIERYDQTFEQYGYFADAVKQVDPNLVTTSGSFGSSPGVGARGGWPWAAIPGRPIFERMPVQQAYDWNELSSSKPMHLEALIDRLHSYYPTKTTWAIVDDFKLFLGREARQRAYALAAARGLDAIGTTFLAAPTGDEANAPKVAEQKELYEWLHKTGGAYAKTRPLAQIGVLYVHPQALLRRVVQDGNANDEALLGGSHEGKTTEALWLCHAAGRSARIITPEELRRGLPPEMKAILLTGLNRFDDSWAWYDGLQDALAKFAARGGQVLADNESVAPPNVKTVATDMAIRAYITQNDVDQTPILLARNRDNIAKLQSATKALPAQFVGSDDPTIWAVPHQTGDVQYATVVNWGVEDGKNASQVVKPQSGALKWNTQRPIYDVRAMRLLTPAQAARVDLSKDAAQLYALPPAPMSAPRVTFAPGAHGFYFANVRIGAGRGMVGVPVQITIVRGDATVAVYGASGTPIQLPFAMGDAGSYRVEARELLSGLSGATTVEVNGNTGIVGPQNKMTAENATILAQFVARKDKPLTIALTPEQAKDATMQALAKKLSAHFTAAGRRVKIGTIAPNDVVLSLQPLNPTRHFPQWKTIDSDLILLGNARDNLLIFDQMRGDLLPGNSPATHVTHSPFVGEYDVLNIIAPNAAGLQKGVTQIVGS